MHVSCLPDREHGSGWLAQTKIGEGPMKGNKFGWLAGWLDA